MPTNKQDARLLVGSLPHLIMLLVALFLPLAAAAGETPLADMPSTSRTGPGEVNFQKGMKTTSIAAAGGVGAVMLGSEKAHHQILGYAARGTVVSDAVGSGWYRGNAEFRTEIFLGAQIEPDLRYVVGITPLMRYDFTRRGRWLPFLDLGVGLTLTDIHGPDLSTPWAFNITLGGGAHYFFKAHTSLSLQYRGLHFSNAGAHLPNNGINTHMFIAGLNWFY